MTDLTKRIRLAQRDAGEKAVIDWLRERGLLDSQRTQEPAKVICLSCGKPKDKCDGC